MDTLKFIIHVDDDIDITGVASRILTFGGFRVHCVQDPFTIPNSLWPTADLLIVDWMLPQTNGLKVFDSARAQGFRGDCLLLTAREIIGNERLQISERNIYYMRKPFGPASLIAMITRIFSHS